MGLGTKVRLSRLFSHSSGRLFGGAVDHFVGYGNVREGGLADLPGALARVMAGGPDYISIQPGAARHLWSAYAGKAALVIQAGCFTPDDRIRQLIATPEDAVRYGADALPYLMQHKLQVTVLVISLVSASYAASRFILRAKEEVSSAPK